MTYESDVEPEPTESIPLTLEETGWLCHLLMGQEEFRKAILTNRGTPLIKRQVALYQKLSDANHRLMWPTHQVTESSASGD